MKLGLLLNSKLEIPDLLINKLCEFISENGGELFLVSINTERAEFARPNIIFRILSQVEKKLVNSKSKIKKPELLFCNSLESLDLLICWGNKGNISELNNNIETLFLFINESRLDDPMSCLKETVHLDNYQISVRNRNNILISANCKSALTFTRNREISLQKISCLLYKILCGWTLNKYNHLPKEKHFDQIKSLKQKGNNQILFKLILKNAVNYFKHKHKKSIKSYWDIFIGDTKSIKYLNSLNNSICLIPHDKNRFWADPFLFNYNNVNYVFLEEYNYENKKGEIAVLEQKEGADFTYRGIALQKNYHLSYPFIFEINGIPFLIPETGSQKRVDLYICSKFPLEWKFCKTILTGYIYSDTTIFYHNNVYWIFTSVEKDGFNQNEQLLLFYTDDLIKGELIKHPSNPIVIGDNCSRMAGKIFCWNNNWIRPAQDCSKIYGGGIRFMMIKELSTFRYSEIEIDNFGPFDNYKGTHTFNITDDLFIIDAY